MNFSNYHTHTTYCDGADSPEELVLEAIRLGCPEIGFSGHSYLPEDTGSMSPDGTHAYCAEVKRLKEEYADRIRIHLGIELDYFSDYPDNETFDYTIGAVHYVLKDGCMCSVDESRDSFLRTVETVYNGDYYSFAEDYFRTVADVYNRTHCDIIAHFDLITKYNEGDCLFDTRHPRYTAAADAALDCLLKSPAVLEVNTGAIARGYRKSPYPDSRILQRWLDAGHPVILSADCHDKRQLLCGFAEVAAGIPKPELILSKLPLKISELS